MAPDYARIDADGRVVGREEVLASFRSGGHNWDEAYQTSSKMARRMAGARLAG